MLAHSWLLLFMILLGIPAMVGVLAWAACKSADKEG